MATKTPSAKRLVVVLGMHRSGTSAITRALEVLGVSIGENLLPSVDGINAKGFFEDVDIYSLNADILRALGSDWHSLAKIEPEDIAELHGGEYFLRAAELLRQKTADTAIFGFKDPRVAKILPFWRQVFLHCQFKADFVLIVRNPLSVVRSLTKRDDLIPEKTYMLWLGHVLNSLAYTEEDRRVLIDYDYFLRGPKKTLKTVADRLDLKLDLKAFRIYRSGFLDEGLRHTAFKPSDLALDHTCPPLAREVYDELLGACIDNKRLDDPAFRKRTSLWVDEFNRFDSCLGLIDDLSQCVNLHEAETTELMISALKQDPNALRDSFDSRWYLEKYPDIVEAGVDPYQHFITFGAKEGRVPAHDVAQCVREGLSDRLKELNARIRDEGLVSQARIREFAEKENKHLSQLQEILREHERQRDDLNREHSLREEASLLELAEARRKIESQLAELAEKEKTHSDRLRVAEQSHEIQKEMLSRSHADREQAQLVELADAREQIQKYLIELVEREKAHSDRLRLVEQAHERQRDELSRQHADREQAHLAELADVRRQIERYSIELAERDKAYSLQLRILEEGGERKREEQRRQHVELERTINMQLRAKEDQYNNLTNRWMEVEKAHSYEISRLRSDLNALRSTFSWRFTAPLRSLASLLGPKKGLSTKRSSTANKESSDAKIADHVDETLLPWAPRRFPLGQSKTAAATLDELMSWNDERFIRGAYYTVLQRAPDAEGLSFYLARLQAGVSKVQILGELVDSPEGAAKTVAIPGLREIIALHKLSRVPLFGYLLVGSFFQSLTDSQWSGAASTSDFNELLQFDDHRFVQSVYLMVLQRPPDPDGLDFYLKRIRSGISKIQILAEIMDSQEAVARAVKVLGWSAVVKVHKLSRLPLIGRLLMSPTFLDDGKRSRRAFAFKGSEVDEVARDIAREVPVTVPKRDPNGKGLIASDRHRKEPEGMGDEPPLISVIMPVFKTPVELLRCAITSVTEQSFPRWELCICDDASGDDDVRELLLQYSRSDSRIKIVFLDKNSGISSASNKAIAAATGQFIAFLDHDDVLTFDALAEVANVISCNPDIDVIYTDQDKIDEKGVVVDTFYKPDWSPDYFRRVMYVGHLLVVRASLVDKVGGFHPRYDRVQDYELMLRISESTEKIAHVRKVLYHWRAIEGSIAATPDAKGGIEALQCEAVRAHLDRIGLKREVLPHSTYAHRAVIRPIEGTESARVSIVIPSKDHPEHIGRCLRSIFERTTYQNLEVIVVDNGTTDSEALRIMGAYPVKIVPFNEKFNYSKANNIGVACSTGDVIVLLNNDTEVITEGWIEALLANLDQDDVGAVGAMLLYPDMSVQHAGIVLGPRGTADHVMRGFPWQSDGYAGSLSCVREVSGVTGACLMTRKETYRDIGGLVEHFGTHYQDVDLCLRIRAQGKRILHVPDARLIHHEGVSRGGDYDLLDRLLLQDIWARELAGGDPYFNSAFSLSRLDYSLQ